MSLIARLSVRPLPICRGMMRVVAIGEASFPKEKDSCVSCPLVNLNFQQAAVLLRVQSVWYPQNELHTISQFPDFRFC